MVEMPIKKMGRRDMGSKYFGRSIRKWRLIGGISQEELAQKAGVSSSLLGMIERERASISTEILCRLSIALEGVTGYPMLASLLGDGLAAFWEDHLKVEQELRQEQGMPPVVYQTRNVPEDDLATASDEAYAALRRCSLLWYRALGIKSKGEHYLFVGGRNDLAPAAPAEGKTSGRVRKRRPEEAGERLGNVIVSRRKK
jgi:transcriptional regulator with XRE-family HTH domain